MFINESCINDGFLIIEFINKIIILSYLFYNRFYNLPTERGYNYAVEILAYAGKSVEKSGILATITSELQGEFYISNKKQSWLIKTL